MLDLTFLTEEQVLGDNQLDILKKYGTKCAITDFAILLGGYVSPFHTDEGNSRKDRTGLWWTSAWNEGNLAWSINTAGIMRYNDLCERRVGFRPALSYSLIPSIMLNRKRCINGIDEIEYGEYPQWIVDDDYSEVLEEIFNKGNLKTTGKGYTTDTVCTWDVHYFDAHYNPRCFIEYIYDENKYIRFLGDTNGIGKVLSNGKNFQINKPYWIKVEPITWLVDEKADIVLSKYIILTGIQFDDKKSRKSDFKETFIKQYMDEYLSKEIECSVYKEKLIENKQVDIDQLFEETIKRMSEINEMEKPKTKILK